MRWATAANRVGNACGPNLGVSEDVDDGFKSVHHLVTFLSTCLRRQLSHQTFSRTTIVVWGWTWLACNSHGISFENPSTRIFPWMAEGKLTQPVPRALLLPFFMRLSAPFQPGRRLICGERYTPPYVVSKVFRFRLRLISNSRIQGSSLCHSCEWNINFCWVSSQYLHTN